MNTSGIAIRSFHPAHRVTKVHLFVSALYFLIALRAHGETPSLASVQLDSVPPSIAVVQVRTLQARDPLPEGIRTNAASLSLDADIEDLRGKLRKLHFRTFKLLDKQMQEVPLLQKGTLALSTGHTLMIRPLYISPSRIGLWLKWQDSSGMELLDTRMHFDPGESMVTGTEIEDGKGIVLAIDVRAVR
jgi:hypothetical protein